MTQQIPPRIKSYLNNRGISDSVIEKNSIGWNGTHIVIPVHDLDGKVLFNKYRRDPDSDVGPKYLYEKGTTAEIYNIKNLANSKTIFITEGEFDSLILDSYGFPSVSSTGGSGTFKEEWVKFFSGKDTYIVYDKDEAGYKGAIRIQSMIPAAKIIWLPEKFKGKDVTDYLTTHSEHDFRYLMMTAKSWNIPPNPEYEPTTKKDLEALAKRYRNLASDYLSEQRELKFQKKDWAHTEHVIEHLLKKAEGFSTKAKHLSSRKTEGTDLEKAKSVPIPQFIQFNNMGFARCIWHTEDSPSLKYYPHENRVHCYGGCGGHDVIDVVMQLQGVGFSEAVKILGA